jgi:predicted butyrate kinase (DUF1464 family)
MKKLPIKNLHLFTKYDASKKGLTLIDSEVFYILSEMSKRLTVNRIYHTGTVEINGIDDVLIEGIELKWDENPFDLSFMEDNYIRKIK